MSENRYERRERELKERTASLPEIPEDFYEWSKKEVTGNHYLFYRRAGNKVTVWCSACGQVDEYKLRAGETLEQQACDRIGPKPKHNGIGMCRFCRKIGKWKAVGRKDRVNEKEPCYIWQKIDDQNFVIRYFEARKTATQKGEEYGWEEVARNYICKGRRKVQKDYHKWDCWLGRAFWDDCNLQGMKNIRQPDGKIYPGSWDELKKSHLKYSGLEEYVAWRKKSFDAARRIDYVEYLGQYNRFPQQEMLVKMRLYELADLSSKDWFDERAKKPADVLKIDKRKLRDLMQKYGQQCKWLRMYQMEKRLGVYLEEKEEKCLFETVGEFKLKEYEQVASYLSVTKFCNHVKKYHDNPDREHRNWTTYQVATHYLDYLSMCIQMEYDMTDTIKLFPHDLYAAHDKMVLEVNKHASDERKKEVNKKYSHIAEVYDKLERKYGLETPEYIVRPVKSAAEMVDEGRIQHHCVGGDTYLNKHNRGYSYILLMRKKTNPEFPYITIEIRGAKILQWYGEHDHKTDKEQVDAFLKRYVQQLKRKEQKKSA